MANEEIIAETIEVENSENGLQVADVTVDVTNEDIRSGRIIALVRAICMTAATVLMIFGFAVDADLLFNIVTVVLTFASMAWGYWKNNNWTGLANLAQSLFKALKTATDNK